MSNTAAPLHFDSLPPVYAPHPEDAPAGDADCNPPCGYEAEVRREVDTAALCRSCGYPAGEHGDPEMCDGYEALPVLGCPVARADAPCGVKCDDVRRIGTSLPYCHPDLCPREVRS